MDVETLVMAALEIRDRVGGDPEEMADALSRLVEEVDDDAGGVELSAATDDGNSRALADFYAGLLPVLVQAGVDVDGMLADAVEELDGTGWTVIRSGDRFLVADESADEEEAEGAEEYVLSLEGWTLATTHQIGERWQGGSGRWFTKRDDGRVIPTRNPNKPHLAGSAVSRAKERHAKGMTDGSKLAERLGQHKQKGDQQAYQRGNASRAARALLRHHGEAAVARIEELTETLEGALASIQGEDWRAERARGLVKVKLRELGWALDAVQKAALGGSPRTQQPTGDGGTSTGNRSLDAHHRRVDREDDNDDFRSSYGSRRFEERGEEESTIVRSVRTITDRVKPGDEWVGKDGVYFRKALTLLAPVAVYHLQNPNAGGGGGPRRRKRRESL